MLQERGVRRSSRNGDVVAADRPVTTVYEKPWERVLFAAQRDANPFFHLAESIWMLAGRKDTKFVTKFVKRMLTYSDDGKTLHGAYGYRWRKHFESDQLAWAVKRIQKDPNDRRVVIQMWDAFEDMHMADTGGKDVPCNTQCYVWTDAQFRLCLTVLCRSNDMIWGAHGANAVHFSYLQQYIADAVGMPMGPMYQVSNNYHAYVEVMDKMKGVETRDLYLEGAVSGEILMMNTDHTEFDEDAKMMLEENVTLGLRNNWLRRVAVPVLFAHAAYAVIEDDQRFWKAKEIVRNCNASDWRLACLEWLERREAAHNRAKDDGVNHDG